MQTKTQMTIACLCSALMIAVTAFQAHAQTIDPHLDADDDAYMDRQAEAFLSAVGATLEKVPPQYPESNERNLALLLVDAVLHDQYAAQRQAVREFHEKRMELVAAGLEKGDTVEGLKVWRLYNHCFIARSATVTVAFDMYRGSEGFRVPEDLQRRLIDQCDVMFISHRHADHADEWVARAFLDQGKPVVAPDDIWNDKPIHEKITHMKRETHTVQTLAIQNGKQELRLVVYPGAQRQGNRIPNNVTLVITPEDYSVMHNGDQINDPYPEYQEDFAWIDEVAKHHKVDVLLTNCWMNDIFRMVRGVDPSLVIPGHENELGHPIYDRVPYWGDAAFLKNTYPELKRSDYPLIRLAWGESYEYRRER